MNSLEENDLAKNNRGRKMKKKLLKDLLIYIGLIVVICIINSFWTNNLLSFNKEGKSLLVGNSLLYWMAISEELFIKKRSQKLENFFTIILNPALFIFDNWIITVIWPQYFVFAADTIFPFALAWFIVAAIDTGKGKKRSN